MSQSVICYDILPGIANICAVGVGICFDHFACYITPGEKRVTQYIDHTMGQMFGD